MYVMKFKIIEKYIYLYMYIVVFFLIVFVIDVICCINKLLRLMYWYMKIIVNWL